MHIVVLPFSFYPSHACSHRHTQFGVLYTYHSTEQERKGGLMVNNQWLLTIRVGSFTAILLTNHILSTYTIFHQMISKLFYKSVITSTSVETTLLQTGKFAYYIIGESS